jgi:hypothetical protein
VNGNGVLWEIFGDGGVEVTAEWRKLQSSEATDLNCSKDTVTVKDSRKIRWAGHVARVGDKKCV